LVNEGFLYFVNEGFLCFVNEGFLYFVNEGFLYIFYEGFLAELQRSCSRFMFWLKEGGRMLALKKTLFYKKKNNRLI
jgi:hypothetical protein